MKLKREGTPKQDMNMKKLFRRNQIIITTLAIMIAAAGYLNYAENGNWRPAPETEFIRQEPLIFPRRTCWRRTRKTDWETVPSSRRRSPRRKDPDFRQRHRRREAFWQNQMRERSWPRLTAGMAVRRPAWKIRGRQCSPAALRFPIT